MFLPARFTELIITFLIKAESLKIIYYMKSPSTNEIECLGSMYNSDLHQISL
jgi:hypothetical protein